MQGPDDLEITQRDLLSCLDVRFWPRPGIAQIPVA